jgi:hypothetical protein
VLPRTREYDTITLRDLKRSSVKIFKKLGITKDLDKSDILMDAMLELDAHSWVSLINESRVSARSCAVVLSNETLDSFLLQFLRVCLVWSSCHTRNSHRAALYIRESKTESL